MPLDIICFTDVNVGQLTCYLGQEDYYKYPLTSDFLQVKSSTLISSKTWHEIILKLFFFHMRLKYHIIYLSFLLMMKFLS